MSRASQSAQFIAAPLPRLDSPSTPERWSDRAQLDRGGDGRPKAGEAMTEASSLRPVQTFRQYSGDGDLSHSAIYRGQPGLSHRRECGRALIQDRHFVGFVVSINHEMAQPGGGKLSPRPTRPGL